MARFRSPYMISVRNTGQRLSNVYEKQAISEMAQEIINGKHGIGHEQRMSSLCIDLETYNKVRAEVNNKLNTGSLLDDMKKDLNNYREKQTGYRDRLRNLTKETNEIIEKFEEKTMTLSNGLEITIDPKSLDGWDDF